MCRIQNMAARDPELFCDLCEEQFEYPCRFKRHLATDRHKMFSGTLEINVDQESEDTNFSISPPAPQSCESHDSDEDSLSQLFPVISISDQVLQGWRGVEEDGGGGGGGQAFFAIETYGNIR